LGLQREDFVIGVGAFIREKNIDFILRSLAKIRRHRPKLVWVGNAASDLYLNELRLLAQELNVSFEPKLRIGDEELIELLNRAKMMVYAPHLEPFGLAPLEANACGLPAVAVAEGGVRETVIDGVNGILVEHDYQSFADAVEGLTQNEPYWQKLSRQSRSLVEQRWSLETAIDRLEVRLSEVLAPLAQPEVAKLLRTGSN
jgi:glycosyltransferase involved in cell wall biosynthesis